MQQKMPGNLINYSIKIWQKIVAFVLFFSLVFYFLRMEARLINVRVLVADLGGIPWLYSSLVMIFSIIAAFSIQKEWEQWNVLNEEVRAEVNTLRELWLWSQNFPSDIRDHFNNAIKNYLKMVVNTEWNEIRSGVRSDTTDPSLFELYRGMFEVFNKKTEFMSTTFSIFTEFIRHRTNRINFSERHMPDLLHNILIFSVSLVIILSLFIAVKNIGLDYVFTAGIATLSFAIYLVINDLDNPIEPGGWHLTSKDYQKLLTRLENRQM